MSVHTLAGVFLVALLSLVSSYCFLKSSSQCFLIIFLSNSFSTSVIGNNSPGLAARCVGVTVVQLASIRQLMQIDTTLRIYWQLRGKQRKWNQILWFLCNCNLSRLWLDQSKLKVQQQASEIKKQPKKHFSISRH